MMRATGPRTLMPRAATWRGAVALALLLGLLAGWLPAANVARAVPVTVTFLYTGAAQTWVVPLGVVSATFDLYGAEGGSFEGNVPGGLGGRATATLPLTPGETLTLFVGGAGENIKGGFNGGGSTITYAYGGGGGTDVRRGAAGLSDRLLVAGGGGGATNLWALVCGPMNAPKGGGGGGASGAAGERTITPCSSSAGAGNQDGTVGSGLPGQGGVGQRINDVTGGGGGGGWYGGAGGVGPSVGGGGSGHGPVGTVFETGVRVGHGEISVTYTTVQATVNATATVGGTVSPAGLTAYLVGDKGVYNATPDAGQVLLGWTLDNTAVGFPAKLDFTVSTNRTLVATYIPRPTFSDVAPSGAVWEATTQLAARGIINGYGDGTFGPADSLQRAQVAALLVRTFGWESDVLNTPTPFTDLGAVDAEFQKAIAILAQRGIAGGYGDGTFGPFNEVAHVQAISLIARSMVQAGYWQQVTPAEDNGTVYPNVPPTSLHRLDLLTYVKYAGAIPDRPTNQAWADWETPGSRGWTAQVLWQAYSSYFGVDRVP